MTMLDDRAKLLLKALVERYIADGQPVGSRTLSRATGIELSPATIRNVIPFLLILELQMVSSVEVPADFKNLVLATLEKRFGMVTHNPFYLSATILSAHGKSGLKTP